MNRSIRKTAAIALVDDDSDLLCTFKALLRMAGIHPVTTIRDSRSLIPLLKLQDVRVVVLDLNMPYVSGLNLLPQIIKCWPQIAVIVVSAINDESIKAECMEIGAYEFLEKPVEPTTFINSIKSALI